MRQLIKIWLEICLLRAGPQDLPASTFLLSTTMTAYLIVNMIVSLAGTGVWNAFGMAVLDIVLLTVFVRLALQTRGVETRFVQVLTALTATGALLGTLALPLLLILQRNQAAGAGQPLPAILWLGLAAWSLLVLGHILRHALSTSLVAGLLLGFGYMLVSIYLMQLVFPASF